MPDLGQLCESDKESLVLELWTRLQAALATVAAQGAEELRAQWEAAEASVAALTAKVQELEARQARHPADRARPHLQQATAAAGSREPAPSREATPKERRDDDAQSPR